MKNHIECRECGFFWKEDGVRFPTCHWESRFPEDKPPCEYDDIDDYEEQDYPDLDEL